MDEDCDGLVDEGTVAFDDDGDGWSEQEGDCRDDDPEILPGAPERPDCKDNDCDGQMDEGLARPTGEDGYEPNDDRPFTLAGAQRIRGPFGGDHATRDVLVVELRDGREAETFQLFAHDGSIDRFHVAVELLSVADGLVYEASVAGPAGRGEGRLARPGDQVAAPTLGLRDESGDDTVTVRAVGETPDHCPVRLRISWG